MCRKRAWHDSNMHERPPQPLAAWVDDAVLRALEEL
jgi:hypothetical protein